MAGAQGVDMALAVCTAGGLGSLPAALLSPDALAAQLSLMGKKTQAPFNVNFFAHTMPTLTQAHTRLWRACLQPCFQAYGVDEADIRASVLRRPFGEDMLAVLQQYRPSVVSFHFGLPAPRLLQAVKDTGAMVLSSATTVAEACWLAERGVDAVIAQGSEAGGHRGTFLDSAMATQQGLFALLAQVVDAVKIPVVAAGAIADAAGIRAALALGAVAVQVGTAYLLCHESEISPLHREALHMAAHTPQKAQTAITNVFSGKPARGLVNTLMHELGYLCDAVAPFPYAATEVNAIRAKAEARGDAGFTPLWCGQNPTGCRSVSATELTEALCRVWTP